MKKLFVIQIIIFILFEYVFLLDTIRPVDPIPEQRVITCPPGTFFDEIKKQCFVNES